MSVSINTICVLAWKVCYVSLSEKAVPYIFVFYWAAILEMKFWKLLQTVYCHIHHRPFTAKSPESVISRIFELLPLLSHSFPGFVYTCLAMISSHKFCFYLSLVAVCLVCRKTCISSCLQFHDIDINSGEQ